MMKKEELRLNETWGRRKGEMKGNEKERRQQRRREDEKQKQQTRSQKKGSLDDTAGGPAGRHYLQCCLNHLLTFLYPHT